MDIQNYSSPINTVIIGFTNTGSTTPINPFKSRCPSVNQCKTAQPEPCERPLDTLRTGTRTPVKAHSMPSGHTLAPLRGPTRHHQNTPSYPGEGPLGTIRIHPRTPAGTHSVPSKHTPAPRYMHTRPPVNGNASTTKRAIGIFRFTAPDIHTNVSAL